MKERFAAANLGWVKKLRKISDVEVHERHRGLVQTSSGSYTRWRQHSQELGHPIYLAVQIVWEIWVTCQVWMAWIMEATPAGVTTWAAWTWVMALDAN